MVMLSVMHMYQHSTMVNRSV